MKDVLHIYAQPYWHQCAFIVGDRDSLVHLRKRIDAALQLYDQGQPEKAEAWFEAFTNDGEGYEAHVVCVTEEKADRMMLPYTDEPAGRPQPPDVLGPYDVTSHEHRKKRVQTPP